jgi:integrase
MTIDNHTPPQESISPSIAAAIRRFLTTREGSPRTADTYAHGLTVFTRFLADEFGCDPTTAGTDTLTNVMPADFYSWLTRRTARHGLPYSPRTARLYTSAVRSLLLELALLDLAPQLDIPKMADLLKKRLPRDVYPTVDPSPLIPTIAGYYDTLPSPATPQAQLVLWRNRALLHTLYSTAMRISECASLRRRQVAAGADECTVSGKGGTVRRVFLTAPAREAIAAYLEMRHDSNPYLFISHGRGLARERTGPAARPLTRGQIWRVVREAAAACGAPDVHPHLFRHYRASRWLTEGLPLEMVQELLGHKDIGVTRQVYAHYLGSAVKDAFFRHEAQSPLNP